MYPARKGGCATLVRLVGWIGLGLVLLIPSKGFSDHLFIHVNVLNDPLVPRLTRSETVTHLERLLFGGSGFTSVSYFKQGSTLHEVQFAADPTWDRIVYNDRYWDWVKEFGVDETEGEHNLFIPLDICSNNGNGPDGGDIAYVFLVEYGEHHNRVLRLRYEYLQEQLYFDDSLSRDSDELGQVEYICLDDNGTLGLVDDDYIWVVDKYLCKLVQYNAFGPKGIQRTFIGTQGPGPGEIGSYGDIAFGRNPVTGENNDYLYMVDGVNDRIVRFFDDGVNLSYDASHQFESSMGLSSIEIDVYGQLYVSEKHIGKIWKFTPDFEFLGAFEPGTSSPDGLACIVDLCNPTGTANSPGWADLYIAENWSDTSGGQWYQIGVKLLEQQDPSTENDYKIKMPYVASDPHEIFTGIYRWSDYLSDWVFVDSICGDTIVHYSGSSELQWSVLDTGVSRLYKFQVAGLSTYKKGDGCAIDAFAFEEQKYFGNKDPYIVTEIYVEGWDGCVEYRDASHVYDDVYVVANDPESSYLRYNWYCSEGTFNFPPEQGGVTSWTTYAGSIDWFPPEGGVGAPTSAILRVGVDDTCGSSTVYSQIVVGLSDDCSEDPPPDPCPMLYVQTESGYATDNNILAASEDTAQTSGTLTDTYLLRYEPEKDDGGYIHLQLREDEQEITTLDAVQLTVVWADSGRDVGISDQGDVFYPILRNTPVAVIDGFGVDRLSQLTSKDNNAFTSYQPGELIINYGKVKKTDLSASVTACPGCGGQIDDPPKIPDKIAPYADSPGGNILRVQVKNEIGEWEEAGIIAPRRHPSKRYLRLDQWAKEDEDLWVRLSWDESYRTDYLGYYLFDTEGIKQDYFTIETALHSSTGDISQVLASTDDETAILSPGEIISLSFGPIPEAPAGKVPHYVLTFAGRYSTERSTMGAGSTEPTKFNLGQNAPNPFNEGTLISYSLAQDGPAKLEVYNILGQRTKTLVDGFESAGPHDVWWDGRDDRGKSVASGIYFYRLTTGKFSESKKMIVIK